MANLKKILFVSAMMLAAGSMAYATGQPPTAQKESVRSWGKHTTQFSVAYELQPTFVDVAYMAINEEDMTGLTVVHMPALHAGLYSIAEKAQGYPVPRSVPNYYFKAHSDSKRNYWPAPIRWV